MAFEGVDTLRLLVTGMKVARENHRIIANNISNVDTPGFNPTQLDFQTTLRNMLDGEGRVSLRKTQPRHIERSAFRPDFERLAFFSKNDYNKVDLEEEMANLDMNTGRYTIYGSLVVKQFEMAKNLLTTLR
ncbi:MAG TPA: flagellar basal body rod protein FlgB [Candidatus Hydrogenedentes bacterium]|nr:flagellar basal body rod protein FlgB [Candidatus Hydrogenedentota bacterium]HOV73324.1 flagellar basal body rod protein FlgB [Candidatus Hydrogenedentota bacterium]HPC15443.1 flagellar basal body rod protein FlgB [Candidatus Hydrogenedentota bacterium]HRT21118.1 flagellar basal body rod protein FlgB [Candidatus Hydrogenedentota bacterium]HRT64343.1 flagellar basal body rod protein FlgB [Candidatus Hydrogenedentota bacterium]